MQEQDKTQTQGKQETHQTWMLLLSFFSIVIQKILYRIQQCYKRASSLHYRYTWNPKIHNVINFCGTIMEFLGVTLS